MTETLLWQTLEDCFRRSDLTGIAALADEVALTDEGRAATLRWISRNWHLLQMYWDPSFEGQWVWDAVLASNGNATWMEAAVTVKETVEALHRHRQYQLEFFQ